MTDRPAAREIVDHLPRELHAAVFERFHSWLRPSGYLLAHGRALRRAGEVGDWLGVPMFFSQYDASRTVALVRSAGFEVLTQAVETQREGEREVNFLWVLAQSSEPPAAPDLGSVTWTAQ